MTQHRRNHRRTSQPRPGCGSGPGRDARSVPFGGRRIPKMPPLMGEMARAEGGLLLADVPRCAPPDRRKRWSKTCGTFGRCASTADRWRPQPGPVRTLLALAARPARYLLPAPVLRRRRGDRRHAGPDGHPGGHPVRPRFQPTERLGHALRRCPRRSGLDLSVHPPSGPIDPRRPRPGRHPAGGDAVRGAGNLAHHPGPRGAGISASEHGPRAGRRRHHVRHPSRPAPRRRHRADQPRARRRWSSTPTPTAMAVRGSARSGPTCKPVARTAAASIPFPLWNIPGTRSPPGCAGESAA